MGPSADQLRHPKRRKTRGVLFGGMRLGRVRGIDLSIDWSLFIVFWLVAVSLATGVFPRWHPNWNGLLSWSVALGAAVLFFLSVLLHELAHALVAKARGIPVSEITLFLFGGLAHMKEEPTSAGSEFLIAVVGPVTSIIIGILALLTGVWLAPEAVSLSVDNPVAALPRVGPVATLFLWLGPINLILGVFNLVPGFPLDGGRLLRALVWSATGDLLKATRWATAAGRAFAWFLMAIGAAMALGLYVPLLGTGFFNGLWMVLIGWFLNNAAHASYLQVIEKQVLRNVPVSRVMHTRIETVPTDMMVSELVNERLAHSDQRAFPVLLGEEVVGLVCLADLHRAPSDSWDTTTVAEIMTPSSQLATVTPDRDVTLALHELIERGVSQLPVLDHGRILGLVRRQDVMKWLALHRVEAHGS